jgi:putative transposase
VPKEPLPLTGRATGIDVGVKVCLITAEGELVETPPALAPSRARAEESPAAHLLPQAGQQAASESGAAGCPAAAAARPPVRRSAGPPAAHGRSPQGALALVRQYDTIYHAAIPPANRSRRPPPVPDGNGSDLPNGASAKAGLNKSIHDTGWGHFLSILAFKAACAGKRVEAVNPAYTSQDCSGCGERIHKSLNVRTHVCTNCGLIMDRDENAGSDSLSC